MTAAIELAEQCRKDGVCSLFLCGDNWHGGVMGIIAGRLKDQFYMPACVATSKDGEINGSGRSIPGIDLGKIIHEALELGILKEGGGHAAAAGFSLAAENKEKFCRFLEQRVSEMLGGVQPLPVIQADALVDSGAANMSLVRELSALAPFGQGNPEPTLILCGGNLAWASQMSGNHLRGNLRTSDGNMLSFVGFNMASNPAGQFLLDQDNIDSKIMLCGKLKENDYNGRVTAQFIVEDVAI
jgi:single-stranded-DNA-specific exonuclease